ncbi:MAG TPA: cystathionine beta-lyase [Burkholderiaceae bacterium]|nr:cystathionine beta-lyase [Burkholderiaceae bacterium]
MTTSRNYHPDTLAIHPELAGGIAPGFDNLATPIHRASTVVFDSSSRFKDRKRAAPWVYGTFGTPTTRALEVQVNISEGAADSCLAPSGLSAITLTYLAMLRAGDHVLVPRNVYAPSRSFASEVLPQLDIQADFYDPMDLERLAAAIRPNTRLIWVETPGSVTFEVCDLPAICRLAQAHGIRVAVDNTWSAGRLLRPLDLGAAISVQALTKYHAGHGDLVMGSVSCRDAALGEQIRRTRNALGLSVSGDDCFLVLRGMQTMSLRLEELGRRTLAVARWLSAQTAVARVLHPAMPDCPGHAYWQRDFSGASSVFSFEFTPDVSAEAADRWVDSLRVFRIGASWGGTCSLALRMSPAADWPVLAGELVRLNIGLEHPDDLLADLSDAFDALASR